MKRLSLYCCVILQQNTRWRCDQQVSVSVLVGEELVRLLLLSPQWGFGLFTWSTPSIAHSVSKWIFTQTVLEVMVVSYRHLHFHRNSCGPQIWVKLAHNEEMMELWLCSSPGTQQAWKKIKMQHEKHREWLQWRVFYVLTLLLCAAEDQQSSGPYGNTKV